MATFERQQHMQDDITGGTMLENLSSSAMSNPNIGMSTEVLTIPTPPTIANGESWVVGQSN